jgi:hypothetical protein
MRRHLFLLALVACGGNLEDETARQLVGRWRLEDPTMPSEMSFHEDGTYEVTIVDKDMYGRWRIEMNEGHGVLRTCTMGADCAAGNGLWSKQTFSVGADSLVTDIGEPFSHRWKRMSPKP